MISEDERREREIRARLDEVVGTDFDAPHLRGFGAWLRARWLKWTAGAVLAVLAMLLIVYTLESHRLPPAVPRQEKKPVSVQIIPAR